MRAVKWVVVLALVLAAVPAWAQVNEKKININFGGGYTFTSGKVAEKLGGGYNVSLGMTFNFTPKVGLQVEYGYNGLGEKEVDYPVCPAPGCTNPVNTPFYGSSNMQHVDFNLVLPRQYLGEDGPLPRCRRRLLLSPGPDYDAGGRLRPRLLRPVLVLVLSWRLGVV